MVSFNTSFFIEQSYTDTNLTKYVSNSFKLNYGLSYENNYSGIIKGKTSTLSGFYNPSDLQLSYNSVWNEIEKHRPFLTPICVHYQSYWVSKENTTFILNSNLTNTAKINLLKFNQVHFSLALVNQPIRSILSLLYKIS